MPSLIVNGEMIFPKFGRRKKKFRHKDQEDGKEAKLKDTKVTTEESNIADNQFDEVRWHYLWLPFHFFLQSHFTALMYMIFLNPD